MPEDVMTAQPDISAADAGADTGGDAAAAVTPSAAAAEPAADGEPQAPGGAPAAESANEAEPLELDYPEDAASEDEDQPAPAEPAAAETETGAEADAASRAAERFGVGALSRLLKDQPELAKAAEANPRVKAQLYQMARRSQELAEYQDLMPSLSRARDAAEAKQAMDGYDQAYFGDRPEAFWQTLYDAQLTPEGRSSGTYERNVRFLQQSFLDGLEQQARQGGNAAVGEAVQAIRETLGWGNSRSPHSPAQDGSTGVEARELTPHIRQKLQAGEEASRELRQLRTRLSAAEQDQQNKYWEETAATAGREVRGFIDGILANAKLSDYDKGNITRDFVEEVQRLSGQDKVLGAALADILSAGTPQAQQQAVARTTAWVRQNGREILEPILRRAGAGLKQRQAQRAAAAGKHAEPAAAGVPATPARLTARDLVKQAESKAGRRLTDREILELA